MGWKFKEIISLREATCHSFFQTTGKKQGLQQGEHK